MSIPKYTLTLLEDFKCLASDCPDDCCSYGWDITVEDNILEMWRNIPDEDLRQRLLGVVYEKEINGINQNVISSKDKICSLQDNKGLCIIHDKLGEEYLCNTCRKYPRVNADFVNYSLSSASMSCPEITRMLLEHNDSRGIFDSDTSLINFDEPANSLNDFVNKVLNKANYSIAARVLTISRLLVNIAALSAKGQLDLTGLQAMCRKISKPLKDAERDVKSKRLRIDSVKGGQFWYIVFRLISTGLEFKLDERIQQHTLAKKLRNADMDDAAYRDLFKEIQKLKLASGNTLQKELAGIGARYLTVKFADVGFPLDPPAGNYIAAFLFGILPYCFINLCLWMIYDVDKTVNKNDIVNVIYRTERIVQHTQRIYNSIIKNQDILHIDQFEACFSELL
ncbi:MAG: flagellin lysine-N-methylase [Thioalkalispiraceae bacterium]|jgi:hypothetical protein